MNLRHFFSLVDWSRVERIHTSKNGKFCSFSVEVDNRRHLVSIGMGPNTTTLTISDMGGHVLEHAVQQGKEIAYYEPKESAGPHLPDTMTPPPEPDFPHF